MTTASTQCPKCNTTFRVSDAQLQVAKGKVRCGSCLHVFKAADYWVNPPVAAKPVASAKTATAAKAAGKFQFDQSAIDSGSADKILTKPMQAAVNTLGEMRAVAARPPKEEEEDILISDDDDEGLISDGKDTSAQAASAAIQSGDDYSDIFLNLDDLQDDGDVVLDESLMSEKAADESWAKDMLEDLADDSAEKAAQVKSVLNAGAKDNIFADDGHIKKREGPRDGFVSGNRDSSDEVLRDLGMDKAPSRKPLSRREMVSKIEPAPVDFHGMGRRVDWVSAVVWPALALLAAFGLLIQYAWINFNTLARENAYRPLYSVACTLVGCQLPEQFDPDAIRITNMVVRSDPVLSYALAVDAMVQNTASFAQSFPKLELSFRDINNFPVASRLFKPEEYLAGELAGKKEMPPAKSVHISLQIVDPGSRAVSHYLQVVD